MVTYRQGRGRTLRNLVIFTVVTVGVGWLAIWLNGMMGSPNPQESLGMLLWLVAPLAVSLLLRAYAGDGWRDLGIKATIQSFTSLSMPVFILLGVVALVASAILYGELRLATGSVWPPLLLHNVGNALTLTLLLEGFVAFEGGGEAIFTPGVGGILGTVLFTLIGLGAYQRRSRRASR